MGMEVTQSDGGMTPQQEAAQKEIGALQNAVYDMHTLSEQGFSQIRGIARSALAYMQTADGYRHPETIAQTLDAIWQIADNIRDCITDHAEKAGNPCADRDRDARMNARREAWGMRHE